MTDTAALIMLVDKFVKKVDELSNENYQQKEQIEKMKCCGNCRKKKGKLDPLVVHVLCATCVDHSNWELAE